MNRSKFLAALALISVNVAFVMAIIYSSYKPRWIAAYIAVILFYSALYFRRLRHLPEGLRCRIGKVAVTLGALLSVLFFYNCAPRMPWWVAGAAWLGLATVAYFLYGVVFVFDDDEEDAELVHVAA